MSNMRRNRDTDAGMIIAISIVVCVCAWLTHVFTCISEDAWGFLIAGAIMLPVAIVHGIGIWFGFF